MLSFFLENTVDPAATGGDGTWAMLSQLLIFVPLILVFYFMLIRPESKRKKQKAAMLKELIVGDEITTIGGIAGRVISIKDDTLTIETGSDRNKLTIMRWAISSKGSQISE